MTIAAIVFTVLIGIVILFQLGLALGMPWGSYAMGGKYPGKFPAFMRVSALFQILILTALALIVLSKAALAFPELNTFANKAIWFVVGFSTLATILNLITKSVWERRIWAPISMLMLISSLIVAIG
ncbi:hypothetical protein [Catalinimonas niigatensis]|uniref:hypothetical protein n=1 Tax=Catalinimonas niigatensis TaxID=1397264 RepID=UPI002666F32B|nr:hypothetical protein [Catalinimonas niigatensis]WPP51487.1 hypothetical protein PZB72_03675 [Catalinimonas niigatensis]